MSLNKNNRNKTARSDTERIETECGTKMEFSMDVKRVRECLSSYKDFDLENENLHYVSAVEWSNGEGWDISFDDVIFHMHFNQWDALKKVMEEMTKEDNIPDTSDIGKKPEESQEDKKWDDDLPF